MPGTVKWFDHTKKYGFIQPSDGTPDVFVHYSAIDSESVAKLRDGVTVEFEIAEGQKGPKAANVTVVD